MRTFVMGDIHGRYKALKQCLEQVEFDFANDRLIQLGDITDRGHEVYDCVELLLQIKNLIAIKGNHDDWFLEFVQTGLHPDNWEQGGYATVQSYFNSKKKKVKLLRTRRGFKTSLNPKDIPEQHQQFFRRQRLYYIDEHNNCFVHAGFDRYLPFPEQTPELYYWDRELWYEALLYQLAKQYNKDKEVFYMVTPFNEIYIGHTPTLNWNTDKPIRAANIYNLDTGAGDVGRLTIMEVATKQFWQSDPVQLLYKSD